MNIITNKQMKSLMEGCPNGGIVFAEYTPCVLKSSLMVTDGDFGAREVIPHEGAVFDFDWNIEEYEDGDLFAVFDNRDVLQMIQTLTSGLEIELNYTEEYSDRGAIPDGIVDEVNSIGCTSFRMTADQIKNVIKE